MSLRERFRAGLAHQLSRPEGLRGRVVARGLNRGNRAAIGAAVTETGLRPGQVAADVGFGGGVGLDLLLDRLGPEGRVHGVELSDTMLSAARRHHREEVAAGRLVLAKGTLQDLPLEDGQVDALISVNTLYFVDDLDAVFRETARVLHADGTAVFGIADPDWMSTQPVTAQVFRLRPVAQVVGMIEAAGFAVRDQTLDDGWRSFHLLIARRQAG